MKLPSIKVKVLTFLRDKIANTPEGETVPKWLRYITLFAIWFFNIPNKIRLLYSKFLNLAPIAFIRNTWFVFMRAKSEARVFSGWGYRWLAVRYANKRADISRVNKVCGAKRHYAISYDKDSLIVINKTEMNLLKTKHLFRKSYNITDVLESAFYVTPQNV